MMQTIASSSSLRLPVGAVGLATRVRRVMTARPVTVSPLATVREASRTAEVRAVHHVPVIIGGDVVGILCTCDLADVPAGLLVSACMSAPIVTTDAYATVESAVRLMIEHVVGCLPVTADGHLVGILTRGDLRRLGLATFREKCAVCGTMHHLRRVPGNDYPLFCRDCVIGERNLDYHELYEDVGGE